MSAYQCLPYPIILQIGKIPQTSSLLQYNPQKAFFSSKSIGGFTSNIQNNKYHQTFQTSQEFNPLRTEYIYIEILKIPIFGRKQRDNSLEIVFELYEFGSKINPSTRVFEGPSQISGF